MARAAYRELATSHSPEQSLNRLEPNPALGNVSGTWLVPAASIPEAAELCRELAPLLPPGVLTGDTFIEVFRVNSSRDLIRRAGSPSGRVRRFEGTGLVLDRDLHEDYCALYLVADGPRRLPTEARRIRVAVRRDEPIGALLPANPKCFAGGLISLSAEPPEGFFAAATTVEMQRAGLAIVPAAEADVWLYRVPDSRPESYFEYLYPSSQRPEDTDRSTKFLIASGLGPATEPTSPGGREANLLWLGDEQHGPLLRYLRRLSRTDLRISDLLQERGLIQRLPDGRVLLCRPDLAWALTRQGFNSLVTEPRVYRQVYSQEYDRYLRSLFQPPKGPPAKASYLLATSRGCTQGCALCCSGGLKAFQSFDATRMLAELEALAEDAALRAGEILDVFFLDSNFNNHPGRLIEFADRYRRSPLFGQFRFFVRHNTVNGFLLPGHPKRPNLALIEAFRVLGIQEVFMGVDTFDDHSTLTLKSNRVHLAKKGSATRPTYTSAELAALLEALQASGASVRAFYLQNNPWVTDLDRIDSYYNLAELWLRNPNFSIDTRHRDVNRLKPFAGSPIERVSRELPGLVAGQRFVAHGELGELDESMDLSVFGTPRHLVETAEVLERFRADLSRLRSRTEQAARLGSSTARLVLAKLRARDSRLLPWLLELRASDFVDEIRRFAGRWFFLPDVSGELQRELFAEKAGSLFAGLADLLPARPVRTAAFQPASKAPVSPLRLIHGGYRSTGRRLEQPLDGGLPQMPLRRSS